MARIMYIWSTLASIALALPKQDAQGILQGVAPKRQEQKSDHPIPGTKRVKIRSGPYTVPNMQIPSFPTGVRGMLWNYPDRWVEKPCSGYCTVLRQWAGLEYDNGTNANIDSGMWLVVSSIFSK
jgi:hypothetical protein